MSKVMGRKRVFDTPEKLEQLKQLMRLKPSLLDTAAFFECGQTTIEDTIKKEWGLTFREFREQNMVHTRLAIVRKAIEKAKSGDNVMLIFCLKNLCKWSDKGEFDGPDVVITNNINAEPIDVNERIKQIKSVS